MLVRLPEINFIDDKEGKAIGINAHIGRRPIAAFGNSDGDLQMLQWTTAGDGARFALYVHHTDGEREWAYDRKATFGRLDKGLDEAKAKGYTLATYVSSRCSYVSQHPPGDNCFILEDNTVQPFVTIGSNVTLWSGNHIGHDASIGDHCFISSHVVVSGHVSIGTHCFLGVNATLRNGLTIGDRTLIGAGALIMKNTPPGSVWVPERTAKFSKTSDQVDL